MHCTLLVEVITSLYQLTEADGQTSTRLMFLDAGHQMEALLDVMTVLNQVDTNLLMNGCQEIISKFIDEGGNVGEVSGNYW